MMPTTHRSETRFLRGEGRFLANRSVGGVAHAVLLRSPIAHGRLRRVDIEQARNMPGVLDVITADELAEAGIGALPCLADLATDEAWSAFAPPRPLLANDRVRHVGEPIAMVIAETIHQAKDAAEAIELAFDALPVSIDPGSTIEPEAPPVWTDCPNNQALAWEAGDQDQVARALANAAHVTRLKLINNRLTVMPLETRSALGSFDPATSRYTLHSPTQGVHRIRKIVAGILGIGEADLQVVTDDVGGAFGLKGMGFPEQPLVLFAAKRVGRPVLWIGERSESFIADNAARDHVTEITLALDSDLRMLALSVDTTANMGAYLSTFALNMPTLVYGRVMGGAYAIPAIHMRTRCVFTNTPPVDAYRGAGVPESIYAVERVVDAAAFELGVDPQILRRRNLLTAKHYPWRTPAGYEIDSGEFEAVMDRALALADWNGFEERRRSSEARGLRRGRGLAVYIHGTGGGTKETARVVAQDDGRIAVYTGTQSAGQGHEAMFAEIAAEQLGLPPTSIDVLQGRSDDLPRGAGTGGSGSLVVGGRAVASAAKRMIEVARTKASAYLECAFADLAYASGVFTIVGTDRAVNLAAIAAELGDDGCTGEADFEGSHHTFPNGVYVTEVEIDPDTGQATLASFTAVDDLGRILDLQRTNGQIIGGVVQSIGQSMMEHDRYDLESGQPLTGSLMDYAVPRAADIPAFHLAKRPTPSPNDPLGMKGAGEVGTTGTPPSIIAAIADAISVRHIDMPATSEKIWRTMRQQRV